MSEVKWIKITTNIFDDEKIKLIDSMPARDEILVIWFKVLALAGKVNENGMLFLGNRIPYTDEMLATVFNRELATVRLALGTFEQFGMIERQDVIAVTNWEKHQNVDGLDKIREQNRIRQQKYREKQKQLPDSNVTVTLSNGTEEEKEKERDKEKKKKTLTPLEQAIEDFKKFRKGIKKPMTDRAVTLLTNKLDSMADNDTDKIAILEQSILNGWQTVYELKVENKQGDYIPPSQRFKLPGE